MHKNALIGIKDNVQTINLGQVMFETDRDEVKPEYEPVIDRTVAAIETAKGGVVRLTGYADLRHNAEYNQALSMRRARAVYERLAAKLSPQARAGLQIEVEGDVVTGEGK